MANFWTGGTVELMSRPVPRQGDVARPLPPTPTADAELDNYVRRAQATGLENVSALSAFMRQMEVRPQLSPEAQGELVAAYQESVSIAEQLRDTKKMGVRDRRKAQAAIERGRRCLDDVVASNFRLVLLISREQASKRYPSRDKLAEVLDDLVQEGNLAVTEAARSFDPARSPSFSTYAARAIRDRTRMVLSRHTPVHMSPSWSRMHRIARGTIPQLTMEYGRAPTHEELQAKLLERCMDWARDKLTEEQQALPEKRQRELMVAKLRKQGMLGAITHIDEIMMIGQSMTSLDAPVGDEAGASLQDIVPDRKDDSLFQGVELEELQSAIRSALAPLPERERQIVLHRFGFVDGENWTYSRIAEIFNVTAERIRQIEKAVLAKLASPHSQYSDLAQFLPSQFEGYDEARD